MKKNYLWGIIIVRKQLYRTFKLFYMGGSNMKKFRNILALLMVVVMLVAVMPMNVFADDGEEGTGETVVTGNQGTPATDEDRTKAKDEVDKLDNLSETDKKAAKKAIDDATDKAGVDKALEDAKTLNTAKKDAKAEVDKLTNLSDDEKTAANNAIDAANDKAGVDKAVADAKAIDKKNKEKADQKAKEEKEKKALDDAKTAAKDAVDKLDKLSDDEKTAYKKAIDDATDKAGVDKALKEAKAKANQPATKTGTYTISTGYTPYGDIDVNKRTADANDEITVTVKPKYGYVVSRVYFMVNGTSVEQTINNYYNSYYYDRYPGYYYGDSYYDYFSYYSEYRNSKYYYNRYSNYHEFLRYEHRSHYLNYKNWDDRYDDDDYYDWYYYKRNGYRPWYYGRVYDNSLYNTSDKFTMPSGNITVYVEFTDWSYYGYYYDDYYYYRNKKDNYYERQKKAEEKAKEEEEAKAKAEAEKLPQVYENKAVIAIGSNVLDKVSKNVHTVHEMDTPAYVNNGRVMLPLRYVAEALGLQVSWVPETKTVIIWDLTQRVEIPVKSNRIIVNGITYTSDVKPEIKSSRTMLPIANIARALGLIDGSDIVWDQYNKQVTLTRKVLSK